MLVGQASSLRYEHFTRVLAYWCQHVDPDGAEDDAEAKRSSRRVHLSQGFGGLWFLDGVLDPLSGAIVSDALRRIADELFEADWAEARARRGEAATVADLTRSAAQRRHDALVEMARRAGSAPEGGRRPEPLFTVLVGYETFHGRICQLADATVVSPGSLVPWLDQAWLERVVFDPASRVIDVGVSRRLFTGATRRAVQVRDQECFHPCATSRPSGARSTTSSPGAPAATPWPPTGGRRVRITTANGTDDRSRRPGGDRGGGGLVATLSRAAEWFRSLVLRRRAKEAPDHRACVVVPGGHVLGVAAAHRSCPSGWGGRRRHGCGGSHHHRAFRAPLAVGTTPAGEEASVRHDVNEQRRAADVASRTGWQSRAGGPTPTPPARPARPPRPSSSGSPEPAARSTARRPAPPGGRACPPRWPWPRPDRRRPAAGR